MTGCEMCAEALASGANSCPECGSVVLPTEIPLRRRNGLRATSKES
jgi:hypothetical protein